MPRPPRIIEPGQPLHLIQRGNNHSVVFCDRGEFALYLKFLDAAARHADCRVHAFILMTNHVHLLVTPRDRLGPPRLMKAVSEKYATYFNHRHGRTGTLWEGRYRSALIDSPEYFFACSRYIELNALRAGMVRDPSEYHWSSFAENAGDAQKSLITPHELYLGLDSTEAGRRQSYKAMFDEALSEEAIASIRYLITRRRGESSNKAHAAADLAARRVFKSASLLRSAPPQSLQALR